MPNDDTQDALIYSAQAMSGMLRKPSPAQIRTIQLINSRLHKYFHPVTTQQASQIISEYLPQIPGYIRKEKSDMAPRYSRYCPHCKNRPEGLGCQETRSCNWNDEQNQPMYFIPKDLAGVLCPHKDTCAIAGQQGDCYVEYEDSAPCPKYKDKEE